MAAYVVATEQVTDEATFGRYREAVPATIEPYGGRFVIWHSNRPLEYEEWMLPQLAVIEFPSRRNAEAWYRSAAYRKAMALCLKSSAGDIIITSGIARLRRTLRTSCEAVMTLR